MQGQFESAKEEAVRPFPQEDELFDKTTRLTQLNIELDMGNKAGEKSEKNSNEDTLSPDGKEFILKALKQFEFQPHVNADRERICGRKVILMKPNSGRTVANYFKVLPEEKAVISKCGNDQH